MILNPDPCSRLILMMGVLQLVGCQSFSSYPDRVISDYGNSVHSLVQQSVYNGYKAEHPETYAPDGMDGQKATAGYQRAYQGDLGSAQKVRSPAALGITGSTGSGN